MGLVQMGHRLSLSSVGCGGVTVKIGSCVEADIGGAGRSVLVDFSDTFSFNEASFSAEADFAFGIALMIGGGKIKPSVAFLLSCLAKSDACHHSRNFNAKIEAGSKNLVDDSIVPPNTRGFSIELLKPGLLLCARAASCAFVAARSIAR